MRSDSLPASGLSDPAALDRRDALLRDALSIGRSIPLVNPLPPATTGLTRSLRSAPRRIYDPRDQGATVTLWQATNGVMRWEYMPSRAQLASTPAGAFRGAGYRAATRRRGQTARGRDLMLDTRSVPDVGPNHVTSALIALDHRLNSVQGLRQFRGKAWEPLQDGSPLRNVRRVLVLVHGTFSKAEMFIEQFADCDQGRAFLGSLEPQGVVPCPAGYDHVLAFDHPTLSVSPYLNALQLELELVKAGMPPGTEVDVIAHSRGGVVCAWWALQTRFTVRRLIAVGAPMTGTSLASPYRIRYLLDYLANASLLMSSVGQAAATVPSFASAFLAAGAGLLEIFGRFVSGFAQLPVVDGAVALVPGLHGQARTTNNLELQALMRAHAASTGLKVFTVTSDFEPALDHPWWSIWAHFKTLPIRGLDAAADRLFPGSNDLVVDRDTMQWFNQPAGQLAFSAVDRVHHCAYFSQNATANALREWLN